MNVVQDQPSQGHSEPRYATLVAGFDGSERALDGLAFAQMLADATGAELLVAAVVPHEFPYAPGTSQREDAMRQQAEDMLGRTVPDRQGVVTQVVGARSVAQGLHELAESARADALVVGSSHRGAVGRVLAGSIAEKLLHGAPCPVAVAPAGFAERSEPRLTVIAVGFDGSDESWLALRHAESLARAAGASLRLLSVHEQELIFGIDAVPAGYDPTEIANDVRAGLERDLQRAADSVAPGVEVQHFVLEGSPHAALSAAAENGVDLLVVGSRQYGPVRRVLLGGVSSALVRSSPAGVLVVPRAGEGE
jgi:nucleotide-binding universal stress UspA family protein